MNLPPPLIYPDSRQRTARQAIGRSWWRPPYPCTSMHLNLSTLRSPIRTGSGSSDMKATRQTVRVIASALQCRLHHRLQEGPQNQSSAVLNEAVDHLLQQCLNLSRVVTRPLRFLVQSQYQPTFQRVAALYTNQTGMDVEATYVDANYQDVAGPQFNVLTDRIAAGANGSAVDGFVFGSVEFGQIARLGALTDLATFAAVGEDATELAQLPQYYRTVTKYSSRTLAKPLTGFSIQLYYRRDVLEKLGYSTPPATWEDVVTMAARANGTDMNGDGVGDWGFCSNLNLHCQSGYLLLDVLAPYVQYQGPAQGCMWEPRDMRPLVNTPAGQAAMDIIRRLFPYTPIHAGGVNEADVVQEPWGASYCSSSYYKFMAGSCAFAVDDPFEFKGTTSDGLDYVRGNLGVVRLPGSTHVLDRDANVMRPCTRELCQFAEMQMTLAGQQLVNFAPFVSFGSGWWGGVAQGAPLDYQRAAYSFLNLAYSKPVLDEDILNPFAINAPLKLVQMAGLDSEPWGPTQTATAVAAWVQRNYSATDTLPYLTAVRLSLDSPNALAPPMLPQQQNYIVLMEKAVLQVLTGTPRDVALAWLEVEWAKHMSNTASSGLGAMRGWYQEAIGYGLSSSDGSSRSISDGAIAGAVVGSVVGAALLAAITLLWVSRQVSSHRNLAGKLMAPGLGPGTTLVITDIQDSTVLWETLPAEVMNAACDVHHCIMRRLAAKYAGYESMTEGDSFHFAFHCTLDAVRFCVEAQEALMADDAGWPQELLETPLCRARWAAIVEPQAPHPSSAATRGTSGDFTRQSPGSQTLQPGGNRAATPAKELPPAAVGYGVSVTLGADVHNGSSILTSRNTSGSGAVAVALPGGERGPSGVHRRPTARWSLRSLMSMRESGSGFSGEVWASGVRLPDVAPQTIYTLCAPDIDATDAVDVATAPASLDDTRVHEVGEAGERGPTQGVRHHPTTASSPAGAVLPLSTSGRASTLPPPEGGVPAASVTTAPGSGSTHARTIFSAPQTDLQDAGKGAGGKGGKEMGGLGALIAAQLSGAGPNKAQGPNSSDSNGARTSAPPRAGAPLLSLLQKTVVDVEGPGPGRVLLYRGLRIRIGVHSGCAMGDFRINRAAGCRTQYGGQLLQVAMAVSSAAPGGAVLFSEDAFKQLPMEELRATILLAHIGEYVLKGLEPTQGPATAAGSAIAAGGPDGSSHHSNSTPQAAVGGVGALAPDGLPPAVPGAVHVYQAMTQRLLWRCPSLPELRVSATLSAGLLSAPVGACAVTFMHALGLSALCAWDSRLGHSALAMYHHTVLGELYAAGGYCTEVGEGLVLATFIHPAAAVRWALSSIQACMHADWAPELLAHEVCEEISIQIFPHTPENLEGSRTAAPPRAGAPGRSVRPPTTVNSAAPRVTLFRGPRIKAGIDFGAVKWDVNAVTGRLSYRGRVMNRAARIAGVAKSGAVWASSEAWGAAARTINSPHYMAGGNSSATAGLSSTGFATGPGTAPAPQRVGGPVPSPFTPSRSTLVAGRDSAPVWPEAASDDSLSAGATSMDSASQKAGLGPGGPPVGHVPPHRMPVDATDLGQHRLKGISEDITIFDCHLVAPNHHSSTHQLHIGPIDNAIANGAKAGGAGWGGGGVSTAQAQSFTVVLAGGPAAADVAEPQPRPAAAARHTLLEGTHEGVDGEGEGFDEIQVQVRL